MSESRSSQSLLKGIVVAVVTTVIVVPITIIITDYFHSRKEPKLIINYQWVEISALETGQEDKDIVSSPRIVARDPQTQEILKELGSVQITAELAEAYAIGPGG